MTGAAGPRRVTLSQVADLAGVSAMTASYTFNQPSRVSPQTRDKVREAAARLGYAGPDPSARSLRRGRTRTLGVVLGEQLSYAFEDPGARSFLTGVAEVCAENGYGMTILPITGAPDDHTRITDAAVDGFIVWTTWLGDPVLDAVRARRRPAVVHSGPADDGLEVVGIDNRAAARAVGALAFAGAARAAVLSLPLSPDRAAFVTSGPDLAEVTFPVTRERLEGYRQSAQEAGLAWADVTVAVCARNDATEAEHAAAHLFAAAEPPDAVAAMSDEQAAGVMRAARAAGLRIPGNLALTGFDDEPVAEQQGITTVRQSLRAQGATCAHVALGRSIEAPTPWTVIRRGSTR